MHNFQPVLTPITAAPSTQPPRPNQLIAQQASPIVVGESSATVPTPNERLQEKQSAVDDDCRSNGGESTISSCSDERFSVLSDHGTREAAGTSKKSDVIAPAPDYIPLRTANVIVPIGPHGGGSTSKHKGALNIATDSTIADNNASNSNKRKRENCASTYNFNQSRYESTREYGGTPWKEIGKIYSVGSIG